jgi:hypothetical protein
MYYVFGSGASEPTQREREAGVYLVEVAEARYLQKFLDPLYDSAGIGICTSEDEVVCGEARLDALAEAIDKAISEVRSMPGEWPVTIGYRLATFQDEPGAAIVRKATRIGLLEFLERVREIVLRSRRIGGCVHFGGGG